jgi:WW domain-containing oxidoreductase
MKSKMPRCWWPIGHLRGWLGPSGFGSKSSWRDVIADLDPGSASRNCVLITGATAGIGFETLKAFCSTGATVVVGARDEARAKALACELMSKTTSIVRVLRLDLSCSKSVHAFVDAFLALNLKLTVLVNNAGIMPCPFDADSHRDLAFHVNFLNHFVLTQLLLESFDPAGARVVTVTSEVYRFSYPEGIRFGKIDDDRGYDSVKSYAQSKLALLLWTRYQGEALRERGVQFFAVHPGSVATQGSARARKSSGWRGALLHCVGAPFVKSVECGAATTIYCALHPGASMYNRFGEYYFASCNPRGVREISRDATLARRLVEYAARELDASA